MGMLVDGRWTDAWYDTEAHGGRFKRTASRFRRWVTSDGAPGPTGDGGFRAEAGRYHLYVSSACPWSHRTMIYRRIKGLEGLVSMSVVHWDMGSEGWSFQPGPGVVPDPVMGAAHMHQVYTAADPSYTGRVTVPVLWDRERRTIVSNESSDIIRMFNSSFDEVGASAGDYRPPALQGAIDELNARIYRDVNNGVYKAGFATTQEAYEEAVRPLFRALDELETRLGESRYLLGSSLTESDWMLLPTLLRFDLVYVGHFKCNLRRLVDYPNLWAYTRALYQIPGVRETVDFHHIKHHYYQSHPKVNPTGVVPVGPLVDFDEPHGRGPGAREPSRR